jgi:hypothetical protein
MKGMALILQVDLRLYPSTAAALGCSQQVVQQQIYKQSGFALLQVQSKCEFDIRAAVADGPDSYSDETDCRIREGLCRPNDLGIGKALSLCIEVILEYWTLGSDVIQGSLLRLHEKNQYPGRNT